MNEEGFIFTMDSVLMLIPIFIIMATIAGIIIKVPHESPYYTAQDAMDLMALAGENATDTNLITLANNITKGDVSGAINAANRDLKPILNSFRMHYNLTYYRNSTGTFETLINNGTMSTAIGTIASSTKTYGNVTFRIYMWG